MSDQKPQSDQATTPGDTSKARQGVEWLSQWLQPDSQADAPDGTEQAEPQTDEQTEPEELDPSDETDTTLEQIEENPEESATETDEDAEPLAEVPTRPEGEQKRPLKWVEAGLIAGSLLFNAASAEAATLEMAQTQPYEQPTTVLEVKAAPSERQAAPLEHMPGEVDPEIEVLSDALDLERQRRSEEDAAGCIEEPTISAAPPPPDADPV